MNNYEQYMGILHIFKTKSNLYGGKKLHSIKFYYLTIGSNQMSVREIRKIYLLPSKSLLLFSYHTGVMSLHMSYKLVKFNTCYNGDKREL